MTKRICLICGLPQYSAHGGAWTCCRCGAEIGEQEEGQEYPVEGDKYD